MLYRLRFKSIKISLKYYINIIIINLIKIN